MTEAIQSEKYVAVAGYWGSLQIGCLALDCQTIRTVSGQCYSSLQKLCSRELTLTVCSCILESTILDGVMLLLGLVDRG